MEVKKTVLLSGTFILAALLLFVGYGSGKDSTGDGQVIDDMYENGTMKTISEKYFGARKSVGVRYNGYY